MMRVLGCISLGLYLNFMGSAANASCFERYYTEEHLKKHPKQVVKNIIFDLQDIYDEVGSEGAKVKLQIQMTDKLAQPLIAQVNSVCSYKENSNRSEGTCLIQSPGKGSFTFKADTDWMYNATHVMVQLSVDSEFENVTLGALQKTIVVPSYDQNMKINNNKKVTDLRYQCEPIIFMPHVYNFARLWNEVALYSVRNDLARPTVIARNLYHLSALMWDVSAAYDGAKAFLLDAKAPFAKNPSNSKNVAMSFAAITFLKERFKNAPANIGDQYPVGDGDSGDSKPDMLLSEVYDRIIEKLDFNLKLEKAHADFGVSLAEEMLKSQREDGSNETGSYKPGEYELKNPFLMDISQTGMRRPYNNGDMDPVFEAFYDYYNTLSEEFIQKNYEMLPILFDSSKYLGEEIESQVDINHWIPLNIPGAIDQGGSSVPSDQKPLTLFWGQLKTFSDLRDFKSKDKLGVYFDPGDSLPLFESDADSVIKANLQVIEFSSMLNPMDIANQDFDDDGKPDINLGAELMDISPLNLGNNTLGTNDGKGRKMNPITGKPYEEYKVKKANYYRSIAEYWADGPESETPPGHWNTIANYAMDEMLKKSIPLKWKGQGPELSLDEYQLKLYLTLNGALHDAAIVAWGIKGHYQGNRPVSVIRKFAEMAESDAAFAQKLISFSPNNLKMVSFEKTVKDEQGLTKKVKLTKLAVKAWRGRDIGEFYINEGPSFELRDMSFTFRDEVSKAEREFYKEAGVAGVGWILAENWLPFQRQTFVTPPFPGFISGHSTFSRAGAEVLAGVTGTEYFPGGLGLQEAPKLQFENEVTPFQFQWATYYDAADVSAISRLYGGIHANYDDFPARKIGSQIGKKALETVEKITEN